ncbi:sigma-70 family RNA polymerase sigma factor [Rhodohalobacter sp.]|uniref:RNA polymerase sigma factor n=1 Tax=Rhodohalobacter sp. TaxID=1974210 RepID=UPI002ACD4E77|nr:sigma-70 family RNA polymerase sigma factor [Rhodohalobacter sp.]MDZ7758420.1 sigma-70 family RNA polymerase sigma factor [Rhodohalobacter sp.]
MDYSELVDALRNGDSNSVNEICSDSLIILKKYLIATMGATPHDAEDAVQQMFEYLIPKIRMDVIDNPGGLAKYMMKASRHSYLNLLRDDDFNDHEVLSEEPHVDENQIWNLVNDERAKILKICIEQLKTHYRALVDFIFKYPEADAKDVAEKFDISLNNAWQRKHRVIKQLTSCAEKHY